MFIHISASIHTYICYASCIFLPYFIHICVLFHAYFCHISYMFLSHFIHVPVIFHTYLCHISYMFLSYFIYICVIFHTCFCHISYIFLSYFIHVSVIFHIYLCHISYIFLGPDTVPQVHLEAVLRALVDGPTHALPPLNWAGVLSPILRMTYGKCPASLSYTVKTVFRGPLNILVKVSLHHRCPFITGSLTWERLDTVLRITGCHLIGVSLEDRFYCIIYICNG